MNTSETLNRAADLIEERGWVVGGSGWPGLPHHHGGLCIEGGIMAALGLDMVSVSIPEFATCPAYQAVQNHLGLLTGIRAEREVPISPLYRFNDAPGRTAEEVVEVLRAAALVEAARELELSEATR